MKWQATLTRSKVMRTLLMRPNLKKELLVIGLVVVVYATIVALMYGLSIQDILVMVLVYLVGLVAFAVVMEIFRAFLMYRQVIKLTDNGKVSYKLTDKNITTYFNGGSQKASFDVFSISLVLKDAIVTRRKNLWLGGEGFIYFDSEEDRDKVSQLILQYQDSMSTNQK